MMFRFRYEVQGYTAHSVLFRTEDDTKDRQDKLKVWSDLTPKGYKIKVPGK